MRHAIVSYDRIDPLRPAAFRWSRAYRLFVLGDDRDPRRDDPLTALVFDYLRTVRTQDAPSKCPAPRFRLLHCAHRIYAENGEQRWELEARLLAGQSDRDVAGRVGLTRGIVALYHDVFCVCRDRLGASDWILTTFVGRGPVIGFAPGDLGAVWRWIGYFGGPHKLDVAVAATSKTPRRHTYSESELESARRFVLAAQVPTARASVVAALAGMIDEDERRSAPAEVTVSPRTSTLAGGLTPDRYYKRPRRRTALGKPQPCGATP